jgi:aspartyl-tRNA(Asn)/glutamyl-tRNA(Gln) amidotransferase subunit A
VTGDEPLVAAGRGLPLDVEAAAFAATLEAAAPPGAAPRPAAPGTPGPGDGPAPLAALARALREGRASSVEAARACLERLDRANPRLRAALRVDAEEALAQAAARDAEARAGQARGALHGVPLAHKDLFRRADRGATCGTAAPAYLPPGTPATVLARLEAAGAVTLGTLNMSELALGPFGDNAHHGDAENPWRPGHVTGGSSSGSGAAVAAGLAWGALGTDTGGSVRLPAACCGVAGLKPTYGRVSRAGVMPLSWSLDHVGPLAPTVAGVALLLEVIAGPDPADPTASRRPRPGWAAALEGPVTGLRVGVPSAYYQEGLDPEAAAALASALAVLRELGADVRPVGVPDPSRVVSVCQVLARAESAAAHARVLHDAPERLQPAVRARLEAGLAIGAAEYIQAARLRVALTRAFCDEVLGQVDLLATPTIPEPAPALAAVKAGPPDVVVARMNRFSRLTRPFNGLGLPALSVPAGFSRLGLPLGLQLVGRPFDEPTVLRLGHAYERAAGWWARQPPPR